MYNADMQILLVSKVAQNRSLQTILLSQCLLWVFVKHEPTPNHPYVLMGVFWTEHGLPSNGQGFPVAQLIPRACSAPAVHDINVMLLLSADVDLWGCPHDDAVSFVASTGNSSTGLHRTWPHAWQPTLSCSRMSFSQCSKGVLGQLHLLKPVRESSFRCDSYIGKSHDFAETSRPCFYPWH